MGPMERSDERILANHRELSVLGEQFVKSLMAAGAAPH